MNNSWLRRIALVLAGACVVGTVANAGGADLATGTGGAMVGAAGTGGQGGAAGTDRAFGGVGGRIEADVGHASPTAAGGSGMAGAGGSSSGERTRSSPGNTDSKTETKSREFRRVRATGDIVRGVMAGGAVLLEVSDPQLGVEDAVKISLVRLARDEDGPAQCEPAPDQTEEGPGCVLMEIQGFTDKGIVATVPSSTPSGAYEVRLTLMRNPANGEGAATSDEVLRPQRLKVSKASEIALLAALPLLIVFAAIWLAFRLSWRPKIGHPSHGSRRPSVWTLLLVEPENQTYSLSRLQFVLWSIALALAYSFIFVGNGLVENSWQFPSLEGFGITFLLSLGTLLAAQSTSAVKGVKGAGGFQPSVGDLFVHGGVLALERVQQFLWTVIAIGIFAVIVFQGYTSISQLPRVPNELLILMGISSGGYLVGKAVRRAGPVIQKVESNDNSLLIEGKQLSRTALLWIDGRRMDAKPRIVDADPILDGSVRALRFELESEEGRMMVADWDARSRTVVLVNDDGQHAEWRSTPVITSAMLVTNNGIAHIAVTARHLGDAENWDVSGDASRTKETWTTDARGNTFHIPVKLSKSSGFLRGTVTTTLKGSTSVTAEWTGSIP